MLAYDPSVIQIWTGKFFFFPEIQKQNNQITRRKKVKWEK